MKNNQDSFMSLRYFMKICGTSFLAILEFLFKDEARTGPRKKTFDLVSYLLKQGDLFLTIFVWLMIGISLAYPILQERTQLYTEIALFGWVPSLLLITITLIFSYFEWSTDFSEEKYTLSYALLNFIIAGLFMVDIIFYPATGINIYHITLALIFLSLAFGFLTKEANEMER